MLYLLLVGRKRKKKKDRKREIETARGLIIQGLTHLAGCATWVFHYC
jgi:hypothetical protein